jgi:hypothetical protein
VAPGPWGDYPSRHSLEGASGSGARNPHDGKNESRQVPRKCLVLLWKALHPEQPGIAAHVEVLGVRARCGREGAAQIAPCPSDNRRELELVIGSNQKGAAGENCARLPSLSWLTWGQDNPKINTRLSFIN